ncbi:hypothetical protein ABPG75_013022 [Micractinium tetrahymenae]
MCVEARTKACEEYRADGRRKACAYGYLLHNNQCVSDRTTRIQELQRRWVQQMEELRLEPAAGPPPPAFQKAALDAAAAMVGLAAAAMQHVSTGLPAIETCRLLLQCSTAAAVSVSLYELCEGALGRVLSAADCYRVASGSVLCFEVVPAIIRAASQQLAQMHDGSMQQLRDVVAAQINIATAQLLCCLLGTRRAPSQPPPAFLAPLRRTVAKPAALMAALVQLVASLDVLGCLPGPAAPEQPKATEGLLLLAGALLGRPGRLGFEEERALLASQPQTCARLACLAAGHLRRVLAGEEAKPLLWLHGMLEDMHRILLAPELLPFSLPLLLRPDAGGSTSSSDGSSPAPGSPGSSSGGGGAGLLHDVHALLARPGHWLERQDKHRLLLGGFLANCLRCSGLALGMTDDDEESSQQGRLLSQALGERRQLRRQLALAGLRFVPALLGAAAAAEPEEDGSAAAAATRPACMQLAKFFHWQHCTAGEEAPPEEEAAWLGASAEALLAATQHVLLQPAPATADELAAPFVRDAVHPCLVLRCSIAELSLGLALLVANLAVAPIGPAGASLATFARQLLTAVCVLVHRCAAACRQGMPDKALMLLVWHTPNLPIPTALAHHLGAPASLLWRCISAEGEAGVSERGERLATARSALELQAACSGLLGLLPTARPAGGAGTGQEPGLSTGGALAALLLAVLPHLTSAARALGHRPACAGAHALAARTLRLAADWDVPAVLASLHSHSEGIHANTRLCFDLATSGAFEAALRWAGRLQRGRGDDLRARVALAHLLAAAAGLLLQRHMAEALQAGANPAAALSSAVQRLGLDAAPCKAALAARQAAEVHSAACPASPLAAAAAAELAVGAAQLAAGCAELAALGRLADAVLPQLRAAAAAEAQAAAQQLSADRCAALAARRCAHLGCTGAALLLSATAPRQRRCGGCHQVRYCSDACCRDDWRSHKAACRQHSAAASGHAP